MAQISITGNLTYTETFDGVGATGTTYPLGWSGVDTDATPGSNTLIVGAGAGTGGGLYNFGTASATDRALGSLASGSFLGAFGASFINNTGSTLEGANLKLGFRSEQWRSGSSATANEVWTFEWKLGGNFNDTTGWSTSAPFNIAEILTTLTDNAAKDGNATGNFATLPLTTFTAVSGWANGQTLHIRWRDANEAGNDCAMAIDEFSLDVSGVVPASPPLFWDANGTTAGAGVIPNGIWGTDTFWTTTADGTGATAAWTPGENAIFSAGTDAVGPYTVTVNGTQSVGGMTFQEGPITLTGGILSMSDSTPLLTVETSLVSVASTISGSTGIIKSGSGKLALTGVSDFTGPVVVSGGTLEISADSALGNVGNSITLNGTLRATGSLSLPSTRGLTGTGTFSIPAGSQLDIAGSLAMTATTLADAGTLNVTGTGNSLGAVTMAGTATIQGTEFSLTGLSATHATGESTVSQSVNFGTTTRTLTVTNAAASLQLPSPLTLGGGGSNRLIKTGAGTLVLNGANTGLNKVAVGDQSASPTAGGIVKINNKDALGITQTFLNFGTIEITTALTGTNAIPTGLSIAGRPSARVSLTGQAVDFSGDSVVFAAGGTTGDVRLDVGTQVKLTGALTSAVTSTNLSGFAIGGTGKLTLAGAMTAYLNAFKLKDTVTLEVDTAEVGALTVTTTPVHLLDAGTKLVIGTIGTTRTITAYAGLNGAANSVIHFDIGGTTRGSGYDALLLVKPTTPAAGAVTFAGKVDVDFISGFVPLAGQSFDLLDWDGSITPDFTGIDFSLLPDIGPALAWNTGTFATNGTISIVSTAVTITDQPDAVLVAPGLSASFNVAATTGAGTLSYQWKKNGENIDGATLATYSITAASAGDEGTYTVFVSNGTDSVTSDPVTLTLFYSIQITQPPQSQTVDPGAPVTFTVSATGTSPAYQWRKGGINIDGATSASYTITTAAEVNEGSYDVVVTGPGVGNSQTSTAATLLVNPVGFIGISGNGTYTQSFDVMSTSSAFPNGWYGYKVAGTSAAAIGSFVTAPTSGTGSGSGGAIYNLGIVGAGAATERALGLLASGAFSGAIGASFVNNSGSTIEGANVRLAFRTEQWRQGTTTNTEVLTFQWKIGGNINDTTGWTGATTFDLLEILAPATTAVAVDGNSTGNFTSAALANLSGLTGWETGQTLHIRWFDADDTGSDSAIAVDDFSLEVSGVVPPAPASYWDANNSLAGAGLTPAGTWGTDLFWSSNALGEAATRAWNASDDAFFSAGSDAVGPFIVSVSGTQDVSGLIVQEGQLTLSGGTLNFTDATPVVNVLSSGLTISSGITGSTGLLKQGPGALVLGGVNTFTGILTVGAGSLEIMADTALGDVANDLLLNGTLITTTSLDLPATRDLSGGGGFAPAASTELGILGSVNMTAVTVSGPGIVDFRGVSPAVGSITVAQPSTIQGNTLTAADISVTFIGGSATIENGLNFGGANRTISVADGGSTLTLSGALTLTGGGNNRLIKTGAGTLVLNGINTSLNKTVLGAQGATPVTGGKIIFNNKDALGISQMFFNYGTLEASMDLIDVSAVPIGLSLASRTGSVASLAGEDIEFSGTSDLFAATGTTGDIRIDVLNHTTFSGAVNGSITGAISGFTVGGTGKLTFAGTGTLTGFAVPLRVRDTLTVELKTDVVSSSLALSAETIDLDAGTKLVIGTEGTTRAVTAYNGLDVASGATVSFDIGGTTAGAATDGYDKLTLDKPLGDSIPSGVLNIAGTVKVSFISGFTPAAGQNFDLIDWPAATTPSFVGISFDLPALPSGLIWKTDQFSTSGTISIRIPTPPITAVVAVRTPAANPLYVGDSVTFDVSVTGGGASFTYQWRKGGQNIVGATSKTYTIGQLATTDTGTFDVVVDDGGSSADSNDVMLTVLDGSPTVTTPASRMLVVGQPILLQVTSAGRPPLTYQWRRGTTVVGNSATLSLTAALTNAGAYQCTVKNGSGQTATSGLCEVGVVTFTSTALTQADKSSVVFKIATAGNGLTIDWAKDAVAPSANFTLSADKKTLSGRNLALADSGLYVATVTGPGGGITAGSFDLTIFNASPQLIKPIVLDNGIVSGSYLFDIPYRTDIDGITPTTFAATGLPPGMTVNAKTGRISGKPTRSGNYKVFISASNSKGKDEYKGADTKGIPLTIEPLPTGVDGTYIGMVARDAGVYSSLGGRLDMTVTTTGTITGSLTFGASKLAFRGVMDIDVADVNPPSARLTITRTGKPTPPPVQLDVTLDLSTNTLSSPASRVSIESASAAVTGWKQIWKAKTAEATNYLGYYTLGIALPDGDPLLGNEDIPQGAGYAGFTVAVDGRYRFAGKTADGENLTCDGFVGPQGQLLIHQALYAPAPVGSLLGVPVINALTLTTTSDNTVTGTVSWRRPQNTLASARTYKKGFGPETFSVSGGRYDAPARNVRILGLTDTLDDVELNFTGAYVGVPSPSPDADFSISTLNRATLISASNPRGTTLTTINAATGAFGGSFKHDDPNPLTPNAIVRRTVPHQGMMIKEGSGYVGVGYFIMDKLPQAASVENGTPATTPTTSPKLSGHVLLTPAQ